MIKAEISSPFNIKVLETGKPEYDLNSVLIKTKFIGICGSDMLKYTGQYKNIKYPATPGHEFTGKIDLSNNSEHGFKTGDFVAVNPNISCGKCFYCLKENSYLCETLKTIGAGNIDGAMQESLSVPRNRIIKINDDSFKYSLAEPLAVAIHAYKFAADTGDALLFGLGNIGTLLLYYFKSKTKGNASIIEKVNKSLNADNTCQEDSFMNFEEILDKSDLFKESYDSVFINCPYNQKIFDLSTELSRRGGKIIIVGLPTENIVVDFTKILNKEIHIINSFKFTDEEFSEAIDFLKDNSIEDKLKIKIFPLISAYEAFDFKYKNPNYKVILENTDF